MEDFLEVMLVVLFFATVFFAIYTMGYWVMDRRKRKGSGSSKARAVRPESDEVAELRERLRVLERIVTDRGYDVATQIEALRDQRRVDEPGSGVSIETLRKERV